MQDAKVVAERLIEKVMPQVLTITGHALDPQVFTPSHKKTLMHNIALIKSPDEDAYDLSLKRNPFEELPTGSQFIILRNLAINAMSIFDWLRYYHDDAKDVFECFAHAFAQELPIGNFSIDIHPRPMLIASFAASAQDCSFEDFFAQDNINENQFGHCGYKSRIS